MAVAWHQLRVGPSDMYLTRKASFKDTLLIGMHQGGPRPVLKDHVSDCTFIRCKHPDCFPLLHVRKIYFEGLFLVLLLSMIRTGCYVEQMKSIQFFNPSSVIYMRAQVNSSTIATICWLIETFKYQWCVFQVHLNRFGVLFEDQRRFLIKVPTLHNGLHNKFALCFPISTGYGFATYWLFIVPNLKCIPAVFAMLWPFE